MNDNRDFKGVWIPKEIWINPDLSLSEKCLLVEIDSLDKDNTGCFASNQYLADFLGISESRCAMLISGLRHKGYIIDLDFDGRSRRISVNNGQNAYQKQEGRVIENDKSGLSKTIRQTYRKREHSNTDIETSIKKNTFSFFDSLIAIAGAENESLVKDFMLVRKNKKATNSETAFNLFKNECAKSRRHITEILTICISRDWKSFKADWLNPQKPTFQQIAPQTPKSTAQDILSERSGETNQSKPQVMP